MGSEMCIRDRLMAAVSDKNLEDIDAKQEFHNLTRTLLRCYAGAEDAQKVLLYELNKLTTKQRKDIVAKQRAIIDRFEQVYIRIDPSLNSSPALLRSKIMLFFGSVNWIHTWYNPKGAVPRDKLAKMAVENTIGGA